MNNQAAQTMPERVADALSVVNEAANRERHAGNFEHANSLVRARVALAKFALSQTAGVNYFDAQRVAEEYGLDYNKFCAAHNAMLAAAPAASGGEDDRSGWCRGDGCMHKKFGEPTWKEGDNPFQSAPHPPSGASVSDIDAFMSKWSWLILARCTDEFRADLCALSSPRQEGECVGYVSADAVRHLRNGDTQAYTFIRAERSDCFPIAVYTHPSTATEPMVCPSCFWMNPEQDDGSTAASTQGLRELVQRWRDLEESEAASIGESIVYGECADELESLLGRGGNNG